MYHVFMHDKLMCLINYEQSFKTTLVVVAKLGYIILSI